MYSSRPSFTLGFHGIDAEVGRRVLNGEIMLRHSTNSYDWLGHGIYFWENSPERAWQWAEHAAKRHSSKIKNPFVLGAVIDLGNCLDLLDKRWLDFLRTAYTAFVRVLGSHQLPSNQAFGGGDPDFKKRELDCAVIRYAIEFAKTEGIRFDSVRAAFWEGEELYPDAGFRSHNHIQLSVINPNCIKGIFLPREKVDF